MALARLWPWLGVALLWAMTTHAILRTDQGLYEDARYVQQFQDHAPPPILAVRGLGSWTLWYQINHGLTPQGIRRGNIALYTIVAGLTGIVAWQLGLSAWLATGLMIVHPLAVETLGLMSGRLELIAACGVLLACLSPLSARTLLWIMLGLAGKEIAIVGVALVPLFAWLKSSASWGRRDAAAMYWIAVLVVMASAWQFRTIGLTVGIVRIDPWAWARLQGAASWRLLTLLVLPVHQTIDFDYDALSGIQTWAACLCLLSVAYCAWTLRQGNALMATCLTWMLLVCAPRLIVQTPKSYLNEHQMYLALPAFALLVCAGAKQLAGASASCANG